MMYQRSHHQLIANILYSLNADLLFKNKCYFAGGTAIALIHGEYRESVDIDFMVSDREGYRNIRNLLQDEWDLSPLCKPGINLPLAKRIRKDQYGIRTAITTPDNMIKFEIVSEGRIAFELPTTVNQICNITCLTTIDQAASKILANSDRWRDDIYYSRDVIDLAMLQLMQQQWLAAQKKVLAAYGTSAIRDLHQAIEQLLERQGWLEQCMAAMAISLPKIQLWQRLTTLQKLIKKT